MAGDWNHDATCTLVLISPDIALSRAAIFSTNRPFYVYASASAAARGRICNRADGKGERERERPSTDEYAR